MNTHIINQIIPKVTNGGFVRSFLFGAGLSYSMENENYWHIPIILFFPTSYSGYHIYKNKEHIIRYLNTSFVHTKKSVSWFQ